MLAKVHSVDFFHIRKEHRDIDETLCMWARWVRPRSSGWQTQPMFRQYRSHAWQWHTPEIHLPINTLDAHNTEKAVAALPEKQRDAIRWNYVFRNNAIQMARQLGVSNAGLLELINQGRTMLNNRLLKG